MRICRQGGISSIQPYARERLLQVLRTPDISLASYVREIRPTLRTFHPLSSPVDPGIDPLDVHSPSQSTLIPDLGILHFRRYMSVSTEIDEVEPESKVSRLLPS